MRAQLLSLLFAASAVLCQTTCGKEAGKCGKDAPCCSPQGTCGSTPLHCGGGCKSEFSFSSNPEDASCFADRPSLGRKCASGRYDFSPKTTWMQNAEAYNGNHQSADFVVYGYSDSKVSVGGTGGLTLAVTSPENNDMTKPGNSAIVSSTSYMLYGSFSARVKASAAAGIVTSFLSLSQDDSRINWDWTGGKNNNKGQMNYFESANATENHQRMVLLPKNSADEVHEYGVDWQPDRITWTIDGKEVRSIADHKIHKPSLIQFTIRDMGADTSTREWAGGVVDWVASKTYSATFESVTIRCASDAAAPTAPPARLEGVAPPTLKDTALKAVVPGLKGFDLTNTTAKAVKKSENQDSSAPNRSLGYSLGLAGMFGLLFL